MKKTVMLALACNALLDVACASWAVARDVSRPGLMDVYRHLHANPELSLMEEKTAAYLADQMADLGFEVTTGVGGHGLVALYGNGEGPTVLLRADTDGLPVKEQTGLPYASRVEVVDLAGQEVSVMHACGHDIHMTAWLGAARELVARQDDWSGTLMMIAQPAEERGMGARMMLEDGLFERFPVPDYNLALHVSPEFPVGTAGMVSGYAMANVDSVDIEVHGVGGHGAYPHTTRDPVVLASAIVMNLQTIVSRQVSPLDPVVITVGSIHGGTKHNVISDRVKLQLTVRSYSDETRAQLLSAIETIAVNQARAMGWQEDKLPQVSIKDEYTPSVYNSPDLVARLTPVFADAIGAENLLEREPSMGGEDFARYGRTEHNVPGVIFWIGAVGPEKYRQARENGVQLPSLHSPLFAPDAGKTLETAVVLMTRATLELLQSNDQGVPAQDTGPEI